MDYLAAGNNEDAFWVQLLVVVVLAAGAGTYSAVKSRIRRIKRKANDEIIETIFEQPRPSLKKRDLKSGMELLARDFLVGVVEQTETAGRRDVAMRSMCFAELVRRNELWAVASDALKVYTLDADGFYGKSIQCEAMRELSTRTSPDTARTSTSSVKSHWAGSRSRMARRPRLTRRPQAPTEG